MYKINFPNLTELTNKEIAFIGDKIIGLYFIKSENYNIPYPFKHSKLIYIGMSEKRTNSIKSRLKDHLTGMSNNKGLFNYQKKSKVYFTYLNFDSLSSIWHKSVENLESFFILDFLREYGCYPICNNKSGFPDLSDVPENYFNINWSFYE